MRLFFVVLSLFTSLFVVIQGEDYVTSYTNLECSGSAMPYPEPRVTPQAPDSLMPIMINHIGRHGSRLLASMKDIRLLERALEAAEDEGSLTKTGKELLGHTEDVMEICTGTWGALDTIGKAEQKGIAIRMQSDFGPLFDNGRIRAISSYVPRAVMSMYEFTHELASLNDRNEIVAISGRCNNELLRFFDCEAQKEIENRHEIINVINDYGKIILPQSVLSKIFGTGFSYEGFDKEKLLMSIYNLIAGSPAMGYKLNPSRFLTNNEYNALWSYYNLKQYLEHGSSYFTDEPARLSLPLVKDFINKADSLVNGYDIEPVQLRFGHAETLIPFLSLICFPGCVYQSADMNNLNRNWKDFNVVPMSANFRMILFRAKDSGTVYARFDLNERAIPLIDGSERLYIPWEEARGYLLLRSGLWFEMGQ
ncbi:MAG: hypothetical protein J1E38_09305 [Paramuribaculum sp.]|nr:hypothetical protein [Paramuribaculum sp.]